MKVPVRVLEIIITVAGNIKVHAKSLSGFNQGKNDPLKLLETRTCRG